MSDTLHRIRDSVCHPIPPTEFRAWCVLSGNIVYPHEYAIISGMDKVFCDEMNDELRNADERRHEEHKKQLAEAAQNSKRRR